MPMLSGPTVHLAGSKTYPKSRLLIFSPGEFASLSTLQKNEFGANIASILKLHALKMHNMFLKVRLFSNIQHHHYINILKM